MGQQQSTHLPAIGQTQIYHFGPIHVKQDSHGSLFFTQKYSFILDSEIQMDFANHLKAKNNANPFLMQIKNVEVLQANSCSNSTQVCVYFEYLPHTLQDLINRNHIFSEVEIMKLMYCLLLAVKHLNDNESHHGDLCPTFIYLDTRTNETSFKIFDSAYFHPFFNGYYRAQKEKTYCAPQILTNLGEKRVYPLYNHQIADTFSIGLVILQCMSQVSPLGAYSKKYQIDFYYFQNMFRLAERKEFSSKLIEIVRDCLQQRNRPRAYELLQKFQKYRMKDFIRNHSNKFSLKKYRNNQNTVGDKTGR